jgi:hypothetical protein
MAAPQPAPAALFARDPPYLPLADTFLALLVKDSCIDSCNYGMTVWQHNEGEPNRVMPGGIAQQVVK